MSGSKLSYTQRGEVEWAYLFEQLIESALDSLGEQRAYDFEFVRKGGKKKALELELLSRAARNSGLDTVDLAPMFLLISDNGLALGFYQNMCWTLSALDRIVTNDKQYAKRILAEYGLPVAAGEVVDTLDDAIGVFRRMGGPVVVKPLTGSGGKGITVDVGSKAELRAAFEQSLVHGRRVLVEECVPSVDVRVMVVGGRSVAAMMRVPAHVNGDGSSTIAELVERKNVARAGNPYHSDSPIQLTDEALQRLAKRGLSAESVPPVGQRIFLHYKGSMSAGGDGVNVTSYLNPGIARLAERAAACFSTAHHAGVDILVQRLDRSPGEQRCVISEVNCNADVAIHEFPHVGKSVASSELEIDGYFFSGRDQLRPVPLFWVRSRRCVGHRWSLSSWLRRMMEVQLPGTDWMMHKLADRRVEESMTSESARRLDQQHLREALSEHDWEDVRYDRRLIVAARGGKDVVVERSSRSVFATYLVSVRPALEELLATAGIPYCRRGTFDRDDIGSAKKLFEAHSGPWTLRAPNAKLRIRPASSIRRVQTFERAWRRISARSSRLVLEQAPEDHAWRLLIARGDIIGCVGLCPPSVMGDGKATVAELIAHKAARRADHPYLQHYPMPRSMPDKSYLAKRGLAASTRLAKGAVLQLSATTHVACGADTVSYTGKVEPEILQHIDELLPLLGNPQLVAVTFARRNLDGDQWAVLDVEVDPVLAEFAWPSAGEACDVYGNVARLLVSSQRYELEPMT